MTLSMTMLCHYAAFGILFVVMLNAECHYAKWHYAECCNGECHRAECYGAFEETSFYKAFEEMKDSVKYLVEKTCCSE